MAAGRVVEEIFVAPDAPWGEHWRDAAGRPPTAVHEAVLRELADADSPRGAVAIVHLPRAGLESLPPAAADGLVVYVDGLQDPSNLGALARVAEAAGAEALVLAPATAHPNHPRALRASAGSLLRLPVARRVAVAETAAWTAAPWIALATRGGSDLFRTKLPRCAVLALGSEGRGLSPEAENQAAYSVTIPLRPPVESLNATVAAALVLFEVAGRRG